MSYIDEKVAPKREDRLGACSAIGDTACGIKKRFGGGCMRDGNRKFCQGSICQLLPAIAILNTIPDSILIVHGSVGCGGPGHSQNAGVRSWQIMRGDKNPRGTLWLNTNLNERDVVCGGEEKLEQAIVEADRRCRPASIIVVSTCVPSIIGDDLDGVCSRLQPQVSGIILPVHCEGFKTKIMATAYDAVYHSILRNLVDVPEEITFNIIDNELELAKEKFRLSRLVNLYNPSSIGTADEQELTRLLNNLGLEVNILPCFAHPEKMKYSTQAALSISICPTHDDYFVKYLKEKYGVPYFLQHMPVGIENTNLWLRGIAKFFKLEDVAEKIIARENNELLQALEPIKANLEGKKALISAGEVRTLATAGLLQELGMTLTALRPYHFDEFGESEIDKLVQRQGDITMNVATVQPYETVNLIEGNKPDIYIGHVSDNVWAAKSGIPVMPIYGGAFTYLGYEGAFDIARRLNRILKNPSFNLKLKKNVKQPYYQSWYKEKPFTYINEGGGPDER